MFHPIRRSGRAQVLRGLLGVAAVALVFSGMATADESDCVQLDMRVTCRVEPPGTVLVGDPFTAYATVENTGTGPLSAVVLAISGGTDVTQVSQGPLELRIDRLQPGETRTIEARFVSNNVGEVRITASSRDEQGWAAAGCYCHVRIKGLPAIQVEMIDVDANRNPKGIFQMNETFLYIMEVQNDVGTAMTPDLRVVWTLPPELEFVGGIGDRGVTVTATGDRTAESSPFVLAPDQVQRFDIKVRVVGVPARNLVQSRASVLSDAGNQELATETESTTLKN